MELEAGPERSEFALGPSDDRLRKRAGGARANDTPPTGAFAHHRQ
jgi:hypothetical protein